MTTEGANLTLWIESGSVWPDDSTGLAPALIGYLHDGDLFHDIIAEDEQHKHLLDKSEEGRVFQVHVKAKVYYEKERCEFTGKEYDEPCIEGTILDWEEL